MSRGDFWPCGKAKCVKLVHGFDSCFFVVFNNQSKDYAITVSIIFRRFNQIDSLLCLTDKAAQGQP